MKETSPVRQLGNFVDRLWGVSEIGGSDSPDAKDRTPVDHLFSLTSITDSRGVTYVGCPSLPTRPT